MSSSRRRGCVFLTAVGFLASFAVAAGQPSGQAENTTEIAGARQLTEDSCLKDRTPPPCQIVLALDGAEFGLTTTDAMANMHMFDVTMQAEKNPDRQPGKDERYVETRIKQNLALELPLLDANRARAPTPAVAQLLQGYRAKFVECEEGLKWLPAESNDDYKARKASCALQLHNIHNQVASAVGLSVDKAEPDFRSFYWGDSPSAVKLKEGTPGLQKPRELDYVVTIDGRHADAAFIFVDDKLASGGYVFDGEHTDDGLYIDDFEGVKAALTKKYGKPDDQGEIWKNPMFKGDRGRWGTAIAAGQMVMYARWRLSATSIGLVLRGDNFKITHAVFYQSILYKPMLEKAEAREQANGL